MPEALRVLIVEDSVDDTFFILRELQRGGFQVTFERVDTAAGMQAALEEGGWDLVVSDYSMPQFGGIAALRLHQQAGLDIPFIVVSGAMGEELAVEMMKAGADHYVTKDHLEHLSGAVERELQRARERRIRRQSEAEAAYLASLVESCDDAIIGQTLDGKVVSWNLGAERLYGYPAREVVGRSVSILAPGHRPQDLPAVLALVMEGKPAEGFETVHRRKDGSLVEVGLTLSPIKDARGRVIGMSSVARDLSQRRLEENERLGLIRDLTSALARANAAMGSTTQQAADIAGRDRR